MATPFGNLHTSILAPTPTVIILDGIGFTGAIDATLITNPNGIWVKSFGGLTPLGLNWVAQVIWYDAAYVWPQSLGLSNAVNFAF